MSTLYKREFTVRNMELDFTGRIPISLLCKFCMDVADEDATLRGFGMDSLLARNLAWMLIKYRLKVNADVQGRQNIIVETWPSGCQSRFAFREFRLFLNGEQEALALATSLWIMVDIKTGKPIRLTEDFLNRDDFEEGRLLEGKFDEIKPCSKSLAENRFPVRLADLDILNHTNSIRYIDWVVENIPDELHETCYLQELQIEFRTQARYGDIITAQAYDSDEPRTGDELTFYHILKSTKTDSEVAKAKTVRIKDPEL